MAKNILSLQLLRNSQLFTGATNVDAYNAAVAGITGASTNDGTIKLARYQVAEGEESSQTTKVKTIFGIFNEAMGDKPSGYTIYDGDSEVISDIIGRLDALDGGGSSSGIIDQKIASAISALDYTGVTTGDGVVVTNVTETDGVVSATAAEVGGLKLTNYAEGSDSGHVAANDTINVALAKLQNQIDAVNDITADLDYDDTAVTGSYVSEVDQTNGKISVQRVALPDLSEVHEAGKPIIAVSETKGQVAASAGTINAEYVNVTDTDNHFTATTVEGALAEVYSGYVAADAALKSEILGGASASADTLGELETLINNLSGDAATYTIRKDTTGLPAEIKERYTLVETKNGASTDKQVTIDIPKDSHIVSINYITTGEHAQNLEYVYIDASGNTQTTYVDMANLVLETEFASGVTSTDGIVHGVVDPASEKDSQATPVDFLTVGENGFKVSGIKDEIDRKIAALDVTGDTAVTGQYVAAIEENDGIVAVKTRANVSEAVLNNYAKGTAPATLDISASDTVNQALAKLEHQIDAVETQAAASKTLVAKDANASHLTISSAIDSSNSALTFTIGESDIASKTDLDALSGKAVTAVEMTGGTAAVAAHTDGTKKITINTNGSQVLATGYQKGTDASAIAASDSINVALAKLENQIDKAKSAATTVVVEGTDSGNNMTVVESTDATDGHKIYTINLTDVASATELDAVETAVGLNADGTYSADTSTNYVSAATSVADAIKKLDTQVKANAEAIDQNDVASTNDALTVSADTVNKTTNLTVNVSDKSYDVDATTLAPTTKNNDVVSPIFITNDGITFASILDCGEY